MALYFLGPGLLSLPAAVLRYIGIRGLSELAQIRDTVLLMETCLKSPNSRSNYNYSCVLANTVVMIISGSSTEMSQASLYRSEKGIVCQSVCVVRPLSAQTSGEVGLSWLLDFDPAAPAGKNCWFNFGGPGCSPRIAGQGSYDKLES